MDSIARVNIELAGIESRSYPVLIGPGLISSFSTKLDRAKFSNVLIVADQSVAEAWLPKIDPIYRERAEVLPVGPGEQAKSLASIERIWQALLKAGCDRKSLVITLGGGSTLDAGAFAASTYMRGVRFVHIPTTLLAQADAAVGGKSAINIAGVKNLVGTFAQPEAVIIDPDTLSTQSPPDFRAGLAEIVKHAVIRDADLFADLERLAGQKLEGPAICDLVKRSCQIKKSLVEEDPHEKHIRKLLNFGHTVGHAVEAAALARGVPLRHGEAVAIGMCAEASIAEVMGLCAHADVFRLGRLLDAMSLPQKSPIRVAPAEVINLIMHDKKTAARVPHWTLNRGIGDAGFDYEVPDDAVLCGLNSVDLTL